MQNIFCLQRYIKVGNVLRSWILSWYSKIPATVPINKVLPSGPQPTPAVPPGSWVRRACPRFRSGRSLTLFRILRGDRISLAIRRWRRWRSGLAARCTSCLPSTTLTGRSGRRGIELERCDLWRVLGTAIFIGGEDVSKSALERLKVPRDRVSTFICSALFDDTPAFAAREGLLEGEVANRRVIIGCISVVELPISEVWLLGPGRTWDSTTELWRLGFEWRSAEPVRLK